MMELHITASNYTTELVLRAGITPSNLIYTFPMPFLNDRSLWRGYLPPQIKKFDKVIFWHEDDVNSILLLALLSTLQVKLWHIEIPHTLQEKDVPLFYQIMQPVNEDEEPANRHLWEYALQKPKEPMTKDSSSPYGYEYGGCLIDIFNRRISVDKKRHQRNWRFWRFREQANSVHENSD